MWFLAFLKNCDPPQKLTFLGQNGHFRQYFCYFCFFCLNLTKKCKKWCFKENVTFDIFDNCWALKISLFWAKTPFSAIFLSFLALAKKCKQWCFKEKVTFDIFENCWSSENLTFWGQKHFRSYFLHFLEPLIRFCWFFATFIAEMFSFIYLFILTLYLF